MCYPIGKVILGPDGQPLAPVVVLPVVGPVIGGDPNAGPPMQPPLIPPKRKASSYFDTLIRKTQVLPPGPEGLQVFGALRRVNRSR